MRIEHDPDSGCEGCPLFAYNPGTAHDDAAMRESPRDECRAVERSLAWACGYRESAPTWCPLRSDDVTVTARRERPEVEVGNERACSCDDGIARNAHAPWCVRGPS